MMGAERENLESLSGQIIGSTPSTGEIKVTAEFIEERMAEHEAVLVEIQNGIMVSKSMNGNEELGGRFDPKDIDNIGERQLQCSIFLKDGTEKMFGPYQTTEEMLAAVEQFCEKQVMEGKLEQEEAEEIIRRYS